MVKIMSKQCGQAFVGGVVLILISILFSSYFLYLSESFFRLFSNSEKANYDKVKEITQYANILNEISINNQNIIASITSSQNAFLKSIEYGIYVGFHQPYWETYSSLNKSQFSRLNVSKESKEIILKFFKSYSLNSARGFFIAKALAEKNKNLLKKLPIKIRKNFIESSNHRVNCFALEVENKYYKNPGILNIPFLSKKIIYNFYLQRSGLDKCTIEHKPGFLSKFMELSLPNFLTNEKDKVLYYKDLDKLMSHDIQFLKLDQDYKYGITYVDSNQKFNFIDSLNFASNLKNSGMEEKFSIINNFFSKLIFFKGLNLDNKENLLKTIIQTNFILTHKLMNNKNKFISNEDFIKLFFYPNWTVTGIYEVK